MRFTLRDYQQEAIQSAIQARREGLRRLLICLPTGAGKTVIFSELCRLATQNVLVLAHREELLFQARSKIAQMTENKIRISIEQGDIHSPSDAKVVVASIRSLHSNRLQALQKRHNFGLIIYDECHHAAADDNKRVLEELGAFDADWTGTLIGFTATTKRADGIGLDKVFEAIVYDRSVLDMIKEGYLAPLRGYRINTSAELYNLLGEDEALEEQVDIESRNALVARSIQELARDRRTIVFCVSVLHAISMAKALNSLGITAGVIYGDMPREKRTQILKDFRAEQLQCLTNVMVLTEGFDDPGVSCIAMARPTKSESLYAQCVGRGARLFEGKKDCIILDFVDLSDLSLVNLPSLFGLPREINMEGEEIITAVETYQQLHFDFPGFEVEASEITLSDIKHRAEAFDPLTMELHPEITAITRNGWFSLGQKGLGLHFFDRHWKLHAVTILQNKNRGKNYQIQINGKDQASFSKVIEAVEAVDFEINSMGPIPGQTALDDADWRISPVTEELKAELRKLHPPRNTEFIGEALGYLLSAEYIQARKRNKPTTWKGWPNRWSHNYSYHHPQETP
jgi:ATP-dependent helicase IRC3